MTRCKTSMLLALAHCKRQQLDYWSAWLANYHSYVNSRSGNLCLLAEAYKDAKSHNNLVLPPQWFLCLSCKLFLHIMRCSGCCQSPACLSKGAFTATNLCFAHVRLQVLLGWPRAKLWQGLTILCLLYQISPSGPKRNVAQQTNSTATPVCLMLLPAALQKDRQHAVLQRRMLTLSLLHNRLSA